MTKMTRATLTVSAVLALGGCVAVPVGTYYEPVPAAGYYAGIAPNPPTAPQPSASPAAS